jgi:FKBP-type peptidyl-prolyl cis-trans isomerase
MLRSLTRRRTAPVVVAAAAAALVLTGCGSGSNDDKATDKANSSSTPSSSASPSAGATTGATDTPAADKPCAVATGGKSAGITVTGDFGKKDPKATFAKGLTTTKLERTVVTKGSKATTKKGDTLTVVITAYNGRTGKQVSSESAKVTVGDATFPLSLDAGFDCVNIGSRVVTTFPSSDLYGDTGNVDLGIEAKDSLVVVSDVVGAVKPLTPAAWNDAPKVTFKGKTPKFTLTGAPSPTLKLHIIKKGKGAVVGNGDTVTVNYYGVSWDTKKVFDESYTKTPASFAVTGVVQGFGAALAGQKVGTRLIVTMPPKYGYGEGTQNTSNLVGQTLVFVVDIISTKAP